MSAFHLLRRSVTTALLAAALASCSALKAPPVAVSPFLGHASEMKPDDKHTPFQKTWTSPDAEAVLQQRRTVYIAPVSLAYLRPMSRGMAASSFTPEERQTAATKLVEYANAKLADAFDHSPKPRYKLVSRPDRNSITLELALVEFNPNPATGGALRTVINAAAAPGVDSLLLKRLKANIAIEGKVADGATRKPLMEFADNQENKSALLFSVNDFKSYGQAKQAIDEWVREIEEVLRTPASTKVKGGAAFVILPWH